MRKSFLFLSLLLFTSLHSNGQPLWSEIELDQNSEISLLTCAPGNEIFECFGHSALRVHDPKSGLDLVFNYGYYEFHSENFIFNFVKGNLRYKLGLDAYQHFIGIYTKDDRTIKEQILNLTLKEKQDLFAFLVWNEKPSNRFYQYHYFQDNCSSRLYELMPSATQRSLDFGFSYRDSLGISIRDLVHEYAHNNTWAGFGIELCMGPSIDEKLTNEGYLFLPDFLYSTFDKATIGKEKLVKKSKLLYQGVPRQSSSFFKSPNVVLSLIAIFFSLLSVLYRDKTWTVSIDITMFVFAGVIGVLLTFLGYFSLHFDTRYNALILWANPLWLVFMFLPKRIKPKIAKVLFALVGLCFLLVISPYQSVPFCIYIILIAYLVRLSLYFPHLRGWILRN